MKDLLSLHIEKVKLEKQLNYELVSNSLEIEQITIVNSDGDMFIEGYISSTMPNIDGKGISETLLKEWEFMINNFGLSGRVESHKEFGDLFKSGKDHSTIFASLMNSVNNAVDVVKAKVEDGKLWVRAKVRKGKEKEVDKYTHFSIEAAVETGSYTSDGKYKYANKGKLFGFILTNSPKVANAARTL